MIYFAKTLYTETVIRLAEIEALHLDKKAGTFTINMKSGFKYTFTDNENNQRMFDELKEAIT